MNVILTSTQKEEAARRENDELILAIGKQRLEFERNDLLNLMKEKTKSKEVTK